MSLQFILGGVGAGKSHYIYEKIIRESMEHPAQRYLIIVPDQFTLRTQQEVVSRHPRKGITNIDVLSFNRLAYHVFKETGQTLLPVLDDTQKSLVLQRVAQEKKDDLGVLGRHMSKAGYISEVKSLISELMQYGISPEDLSSAEEKLVRSPLLCRKLQDIGVLYRGFRDFLEDHYIASEELLTILGRAVPEAESLKNTTIVLDGFTGFTPVQNRLIGELLLICPKVYVTVALDPSADLFEKPLLHKRSYMSLNTVDTLLKIIRQKGITLDDPVRMEDLPPHPDRYTKAPAIRFLAEHLFSYGHSTYETSPEEIRICEAADPSEEMAEVVRRIRHLVREKGYRYREIAVVCGDLASYSAAAAGAFAEGEIPFFMDQTRNVLMNPLSELVRSVLDIRIENFSEQSMFRYLRTGLTGICRDDVDELENYVKALGIRGKNRWQEAFVRVPGTVRAEKVPHLEELRQEIMEKLLPLMEVFADRSCTVRSCCEAIYRLLEQHRVQQQLEEQKDRFAEKGQAALAKEYEQIYTSVIDLLDQLVDILGEESVNMKDFRQILEAGLLELRIGIIPPAADQVLIGDVKRTRTGAIRALFFVGVNESAIPGSSRSGGILSEIDRETLCDLDMVLSPGPREDVYIQKFYLYLHLTGPSDALYVSWARNSASGEHTSGAYLIQNLLDLFPMLSVTRCSGVPGIDMVQSVADARKRLMLHLVDGSSEPWTDEDREILSYLIREDLGREEILKLAAASAPRRGDDPIGTAAARLIYGSILNNSVTRLERFAACACSHFFQFGLALQEREEFAFSPIDMGNILHKAMEVFISEVRDEGLDLCELSREDEFRITELALEKSIDSQGQMLLSGSGKNAYQIHRAGRLLARSITMLRRELKDSDFRPELLEKRFGQQDLLESMCMQLSGEERMFLRGVIDRIDTCRDEDQLHVRIIDYKSGNRKFDLEAFYYGLQIQLVIYMTAAVELEKRRHPGEKVSPAALLYYHMRDPYLEVDRETDPEAERNRQLKMDGYVSSDEEVLRHLDRTMKESGASRLLPVKYTAKKELAKTSKVLDEDQFRALSDYALAQARESGIRILSGACEARPYRIGEETGCSYCPYGEVCGFDPRLEGCDYRDLDRLKNDEIWERIFISTGRETKEGKEENHEHTLD